MSASGRSAKILLIDTNVYFSKRLSDALKREGFEVTCSTQPAFALTTLEYDAPSAIVCSTNMREMGALDIARMIRADVKNSAMPIIALGDGGQRALMEAFQAGCDDYIDRARPPAVIATHVKNIIISKAEGFQPTQMLAQSDTSLFIMIFPASCKCWVTRTRLAHCTSTPAKLTPCFSSTRGRSPTLNVARCSATKPSSTFSKIVFTTIPAFTNLFTARLPHRGRFCVPLPIS
jgi:DNA-binding response OmpR family regulator